MLKIIKIDNGVPFIPGVPVCTKTEQVQGLQYKNKVINSIVEDINKDLITEALFKLEGLQELFLNYPDIV